MFSPSIDRLATPVATFFCLATTVFGTADAFLARANQHLVCMPDDESRLILVGAAALGALLGIFGWPGDRS